jgi:hypothetical protein
MTASNDKILEALLLAEEFIANELDQREVGNSDESDYVKEARDVLAVVREALR